MISGRLEAEAEVSDVQRRPSRVSASGQKRSLIGYCAAYFICAERQLAGPQS